MGRTKSATTGKAIIDNVEKNNDTLTGRGGLTQFVRYLRIIDIVQQINTFFYSMRRSSKGQPIPEIFKQKFDDFFQGMNRSI